MSDSLQPHGLQHTNLPCPLLSPRAYSNSCPLNQRCHPTITSSVIPFSFCLLSFPASGSFLLRQLIRVFFSWIEWFDLLVIQGPLKSLFRHHSSKESVLQHSAFFMVQHSYSYITTGKTIALTIQTFVGKVMCLLFNMLSRFVRAFFLRCRHLYFHDSSLGPQWFWTPRK